MKFNDQLFIIKNKFFQRGNIIFLFIFIVILLIIFTCLTIIKFSIDNKREILNSEIGRTYYISVDENDLEKIKKINHIELVESNKYAFSKRFEIAKFDKNTEKGVVLIKALLKNSDVTIKSGNTIMKDYEMICSDVFYPHEYDNTIDSSLFLNSKEILEKEVKVKSSNEDRLGEEVILNIVGTYKNKYMEEANTCYVNIATYDKITSKYMMVTESYDEKGFLISKNYIEYKDYIIRIDNLSNEKDVIDNLKSLGVSYEQVFILDTNFINSLHMIPLFIAIVVMLLMFGILYNFIDKKINNRLNNVGILKAIGYQDKDIINLDIIENLIILIISFVSSLIIFIIIYNNLLYNLLTEITYNNYILEIPVMFILLIFIIFIFLIVIIINKIYQKILKLNIQDLLNN